MALSHGPRHDLVVSGPVRYLALGDSYTIGEGVRPADRWPEQLAALVRHAGIAVETLETIARTGWTVTELDRGIDAAAPAGPYTLVSLLIGVNNQYRGSPVESYRTDFERLLARAVAFADGQPGRVVVLSIPDWGVTPFAAGRDRARIAAEIDAFNEVNRVTCERAGAVWVDVTPASRRLAGAVVADGLHPDAAQYGEWAKLALPAALAALGR